MMRRREFITLLGGAATTPAMLWPLAARAQQPERMRRIGVLNGIAMNDPDAQARVAAFEKALNDVGWAVGRSIRIDYHWGAIECVRSIPESRRNAAGRYAAAVCQIRKRHLTRQPHLKSPKAEIA